MLLSFSALRVPVFASWIRPVASVVEELAYFKTCMMCFVGVLAVRCLAKMHVGNAHCVRVLKM